VRRPAAGLGHRRYALADQLRGTVRADRENAADEVVAPSEGELRLPEVAATPHGLLGEGERRAIKTLLTI
jgi:hypothetical protein